MDDWQSVPTSDHQISLNGLHQRQGVDLHRASLPLLDIGTVRVPLQLALELVRVEKLQCLGTSADTQTRTYVSQNTGILRRSEASAGTGRHTMGLASTGTILAAHSLC